MKIQELHPVGKAISAIPMFKGTEGVVISLQLLQDQLLKEHITKVPALLCCVTGEAVFENVKGDSTHLRSGDYVLIEENVLHWVTGITDCNLILVK
jgi:quercetin dioxygenase-like cupin family protein